MLSSSEVRWFFKGALPTPVRDWFLAGKPLQPQAKQTHDYLQFEGCDSVGVKLREGKLEIKAIAGAVKPLVVSDQITGRTDAWVKWSFGDQGLKALEDKLRASGRWIAVTKERYLRKFSVDSGQILEKIPADKLPLPTAGCNVELTRIEIESEPREWFTIGFEAFGSSANTSSTLDDTLKKFFDDHGPPPGLALTGLGSLSYPAWLATLALPAA